MSNIHDYSVEKWRSTNKKRVVCSRSLTISILFDFEGNDQDTILRFNLIHPTILLCIPKNEYLKGESL